MQKLTTQRCTLYTLLPVLLVLAATEVLAQAPAAASDPEPEAPPRYRVELILFRYAETVSSGNEAFVPDPPPADDLSPAGAGQPGGADAIPAFGDRPSASRDAPGPRAPSTTDEPEAEPPAPDDTDVLQPVPALEEIVLPANRVGLRTIPREALELGNTHDKLVQLDAYQVVLWTGWTQAILERDLTPVIPLRRLGNAPSEFDGTLQLYLSRYLHLVVDLELTPRGQAGRTQAGPLAPTFGDARSRDDRFGQFDPFARDSEPADLVHYRINEDRIVRNGDLRYFDHPKFGLLAKVTRVEETDEQEPEPAEPETGAAPASE